MIYNYFIKLSFGLLFAIAGVFLISCGGGSPGPSAAHWGKKANFPAGFHSMSDPTFVIGTKAYILEIYKTFWEYDQATDKWTQKKNFPKVGSADKDYAFTFTLDGKGYIGCGGEVSNTSDFWVYDPATDTWTQKSDFPGGKRYGAQAMVINNKAYVVAGDNISVSTYQQDVWQYDATLDQWTQKANMPAMGRVDAVSFVVGYKGYLGSGYNGHASNVILNDFWEYTPATDTWVQKKDFSGTPRYTAVGFSIGAKGYMGTGFQSDNQPNALADFWEYNPSTDSWTQRENIGKSVRYNAVAFVIGNTAYVGGGDDNNDYDLVTAGGTYTYYDNLWSYTPH